LIDEMPPKRLAAMNGQRETIGRHVSTKNSTETLLALGAAAIIGGIALNYMEPKENPSHAVVLTSFGFSVGAYVATLHTIPLVVPLFFQRGLYGRDMSKREPKPDMCVHFEV
jgi:hypothetical protein